MAKRDAVQQTGPMDAEEWGHLKKPAKKSQSFNSYIDEQMKNLRFKKAYEEERAKLATPLWKSSVERLVQAKKTQDRVRDAIANTEERLRTLRKELNDADALAKQALEELR